MLDTISVHTELCGGDCSTTCSGEKSITFRWTPETEDAFRRLKLALVSAPVLAFPNYNAKFIVDSDASEEGIGATLSQIQNGIEKPIAFAAKALHGAQRTTYTVYQKGNVSPRVGIRSF